MSLDEKKCNKNGAGYTLPRIEKGRHPGIVYSYTGRDGRPREVRMPVAYCWLCDARETADKLSGLLLSGWRPDHVPGLEGKALLLVVLDEYLRYIDDMCRLGSMRRKTVYDYSSRLVILEEYVIRNDRWLLSDFGVPMLSLFLDWLVSHRRVGATTRNNYLTWLSALCSWMWDRGYVPQNFAARIRRLREPPKRRDALDAGEMRRVTDWFAVHDPWMLLACRMEYYTMIRPSELVRLKVSDIDFAGRRVRCRAEWTKNRREEWVALNGSLAAMLREMRVDMMPGDWYVFGKHLRPGRVPADNQVFRRRWLVMRDDLGLAESKQFYSLKDSGIRDLANAEGIIVARDQARHASVSTTNMYVKNTGLVHQEAKDFEGAM